MLNIWNLWVPFSHYSPLLYLRIFLSDQFTLHNSFFKNSHLLLQLFYSKQFSNAYSTIFCRTFCFACSMLILGFKVGARKLMPKQQCGPSPLRAFLKYQMTKTNQVKVFSNPYNPQPNSNSTPVCNLKSEMGVRQCVAYLFFLHSNYLKEILRWLLWKFELFWRS